MPSGYGAAVMSRHGRYRIDGINRFHSVVLPDLSFSRKVGRPKLFSGKAGKLQSNEFAMSFRRLATVAAYSFAALALLPVAGRASFGICGKETSLQTEMAGSVNSRWVRAPATKSKPLETNSFRGLSVSRINPLQTASGIKPESFGWKCLRRIA